MFQLDQRDVGVVRACIVDVEIECSVLGDLFNSEELRIIGSAGALVNKSLRKRTCNFRFRRNAIVINFKVGNCSFLSFSFNFLHRRPRRLQRRAAVDVRNKFNPTLTFFLLDC